MTYQVIELGTERLIGEYKSLKRARNKANKLDIEYGAIKYFVKRV